MLDRLTASDFTELVGEPFTISPPGAEPVEASLDSVAAQPPAGSHAGRAGFSLLLRARTARRLDQMIYGLTHERLGRLDVFLVPVGRDAGGLLMEAVFN